MWPFSCSQTAVVDLAPPERRNFLAPPRGGWLWRMWWLWVYWPRKMVARLGQHRELVTNAFSKVVPVSINACKLGMCLSVSAFTSSMARSSVRIKTTFGGLDFSRSSSVAASTEGKQAARVMQASSKRQGKARARTLLTQMANLPVRFTPCEGLLCSADRHLAAAGNRGTSTAAVYPAHT